MANNIYNTVKPFDSFKIIFRLLTVAGFYEFQSKNKYLAVSHNLYRILVLFIVLLYCLVHVIYLYMTRNDEESIMYGLIIAIPQLNLVTKLGTMFVNTKRIRRLHELIKDPIFSATNSIDAEYIKKNNSDMIKLNKYAIYLIICGGGTWPLSFIFKRMENPEHASVPAYLPFDTTSTMGFALSVLCEVGPILWIGFGHFGADCVIATYYSQAKSQLLILKHNLEHIFDNNYGILEENIVDTEYDGSTERFQYIDEKNENVRKNFIYLVERYKKVAWYIDEISAVFNNSMSFQLFTTSLTSCLVVYNLSMMNIFSVVFFHMFVLLFLYQTQVFLYCYFGHLVEHESQSINTAVYFSDWLAVSPRFRRDILIAMTRWGQPLTPRVSTIVPVSLITFASIVKLSYRLYTVMKSTQP